MSDSRVNCALGEQAKQSARLDLNFTVRNVAPGSLFAENKSRLGLVGLEKVGISLTISFKHSRAWRTPMVPTTGPKIPPSPQLVTAVAGGGFG